MEVAVIGAGNMGRALARRLVAGGQSTVLASRRSEEARDLAEAISGSGPGDVDAVDAVDDAVARAEVVILATPYRSSLELAEELSEAAAGKVVVDISNPFDDSYQGS